MTGAILTLLPRRENFIVVGDAGNHMIGELQSRQIMALIRDGMAVEDIANSINVDPALVKLVVARNSQDGDRDITDEDLKTLRRHAVDLALGAEDEGVQARMTQWLIERDKPKQKDVNVNPILAINQAIIASTQQFHELTKAYSAPSPDGAIDCGGNEFSPSNMGGPQPA